MSSTSITLIAVIAVLVMMSAYFSATETAFSSLNKIRLKSLANNGNKRAAHALALLENYDKLLSTILIGNNIVNIASASIATVLFVEQFRLGNSGVTISTIVMTIVVLIFGEISPKSLAKESPERFAMFSTPFLSFFVKLLTPLNFLFQQWKKLLNKLFKAEDDRGITEEELITIVDEAENEGGIDEHESELIRSAIEFNDLEVEEILTPRVDVVAVEENDPMDKIAEVFRTNGLSRLPVYRETIDNIIGIIHEKDFYAQLYQNRNEIAPIIKTAVCATTSMPVSKLLRLLQGSKTHMAIVIDEFGGTAGIVTLEDILEELVGEIWDEHDEVVEEFKKNPDGSYLVSCSADLEDMFELLGLSEEVDTSTVSGWVIDELGGVPKVGDNFSYENLRVTVTRTDFRRVLEIRVELLPEQEEDSEKTGA
mgnify:FL=1